MAHPSPPPSSADVVRVLVSLDSSVSGLDAEGKTGVSPTELQTQPPVSQSPLTGQTLQTNTFTQYIMEQAVCVRALLGNGAFSEQHA